MHSDAVLRPSARAGDAELDTSAGERTHTVQPPCPQRDRTGRTGGKPLVLKQRYAVRWTDVVTSS
ncbi:hypothetical protein JOD54_002741 [Actinokineospora baliensis]|nr:hypothetical protein [Actinokineospora baliensis]